MVQKEKRVSAETWFTSEQFHRSIRDIAKPDAPVSNPALTGIMDFKKFVIVCDIRCF